ncbi:VOC family protein [Roseicyclus mahoneyensis]|uniref:Methylmalonyl-CoA/ethylmalonyl-CoA epimerase n=1 Tax=Roseicyclus mahoneyensis TaxID=164332 RepID=A0A316GPP6_9RHOB|nr:VOC family protein [Roseicyclus mahoneyensis]PWK61484.1 methylmalonyl-CoA/ethylmalonyl-CoA epimerase [Roseicyclus mahoneyensis]
MTTIQLLYVTISTPDIDRMIAWYGEKLGYSLYTRKDFPEFNTRIAVMEQAGFRLEILQQGNAAPTLSPRHEPPDHTNVHGISQFAVLVDDLDAAIEDMEAKGVEMPWVKRVDTDLRLSFQFIKDCDGNLIQLVQLMDDAAAHRNDLIRQRHENGGPVG